MHSHLVEWGLLLRKETFAFLGKVAIFTLFLNWHKLKISLIGRLGKVVDVDNYKV